MIPSLYADHNAIIEAPLAPYHVQESGSTVQDDGFETIPKSLSSEAAITIHSMARKAALIGGVRFSGKTAGGRWLIKISLRR
ncbi:hypothetical protein GGC47_005502 [Bosea sp. OAE752]|uniref:hypothetical protein n=1 Tax=Bosea sp. OAE752 TaxID=2663873 RepID=UPI003D2462AD